MSPLIPQNPANLYLQPQLGGRYGVGRVKTSREGGKVAPTWSWEGDYACEGGERALIRRYRQSIRERSLNKPMESVTKVQIIRSQV